MTFAVVYLRPEIATGFYRFPRTLSDGDSVADVGEEEPPVAATVNRFPGIDPEDAAALLPDNDGQLVRSIQDRITQSGLTIESTRAVVFTRPQLRHLFPDVLAQLGEDSSGGSDDDRCTQFLDDFTCGFTMALLITSEEESATGAAGEDHVIRKIRALLGPLDPQSARQQSRDAGLSPEHWPLRAICGLSTRLPGVHSSATLDAAYRERFVLFPPASSGQRLDEAVVGLLSSFTKALPEAQALLVERLQQCGVVITTTLENSDSSEHRELMTSELASPTAEQSQLYKHSLEEIMTTGKTVWLRVLGFNLRFRLREILGSASISSALQHFPHSIRAMLPESLVASSPAIESLKTVENGPTCLESGIFVTYDNDIISRLVPENDHIEQTFAIIKPNAAREPSVVAAIQDSIQAFGFEIVRSRRMRLSRAQAAAFYAEHTGKVFFDRLLEFMTSGEIVALQLARKQAITMWRALMGPTNSHRARETHPWSLRARFGVDGTQNATHGSDSPASANRELRFFFGERTETAPHVESSRDLAHRPLSPPYPPSDTLEKVLTEGLAELLSRQWSDPLDACQFLGEWLLEHNDRRQDARPGTATTSKTTPARAPKASAPSNPRASKATALPPPTPLDSHTTILISLDETIAGSDLQARVHHLVREHVSRLGYGFVDASCSSMTEVQKTLQDSGQRRSVVLSPPPSWSLDAWIATPQEITLAVRLRASSTSPAVALSPPLADCRVPCVDLELPSCDLTHGDRDLATALSLSLGAIVDPVLVVVEDPQGLVAVSRWRDIGEALGFATVTFEDVVATEIAHENRPDGPFTAWSRTRATMAASMLVDALARMVRDPARMSARSRVAAAQQKFLLQGFPWSSSPKLLWELETRITRVSAVLAIGTEKENPDWLVPLVPRGIVHYVEAESPKNSSVSTTALETAVSAVLSTEVTFITTDAQGSGDRLVHARVAARELGMVWIDFDQDILAADTTDPIQRLHELIIRRNGGRQRLVVAGFPRSEEDVIAYLRVARGNLARVRLLISTATDVIGPRAVAAARLLAREHPSVPQATLSSSDSVRLRGLLFHRTVAVVAGDSQGLDADRLRAELGPLGTTILDLRNFTTPATKATAATAAAVATTIAAIRGGCSTRWLVLGAPPHAQYFWDLQARLQAAFVHILLLKHRQPRAPRRVRREDEPVDDDYDSEEEEERERQRQEEAARLPPELETVHRSFGSIVKVCSFLRVDEAHAFLWTTLRPRVLGVVGHPHSFYREVLERVGWSHALPIVDLHTSSRGAMERRDPDRHARIAEQLQRLRGVLATSTAATVLVDGFPRAVPNDPVPAADDVAPYVADQLWSLERQVAEMPTLVRFRASMDVLVDRKPEKLPRNALEDAQDALVVETRDLVQWFAGHKRPILDVSCEREIADAVEDLERGLRLQVVSS